MQGEFLHPRLATIVQQTILNNNGKSNPPALTLAELASDLENLSRKSDFINRIVGLVRRPDRGETRYSAATKHGPATAVGGVNNAVTAGAWPSAA